MIEPERNDTEKRGECQRQFEHERMKHDLKVWALMLKARQLGCSTHYIYALNALMDDIERQEMLHRRTP